MKFKNIFKNRRQAMHFTISMIKSAIRIVGCGYAIGFEPITAIAIIANSLIIAELVGVLEEVFGA